MTVAPLRVDGARLWSSLMDMATIGATAAGGCDRPALSDRDVAARELFSGWASEAGCQLELDEIGNLFARLPGTTEGPAVLVGSHLDTQPTGGRFDGVYGVLGALEVVRTIRDHGIDHERPIVIADWTNEEGSRFPQAMLGSAVWSGASPLDQALGLSDRDGVTVASEIERLGLIPTRPARPFPVAASFELHIEQGPVLEDGGFDIGVVTGVLGLRWFELELHGAATHAGPTPMAARHDPVRALARVVDSVHEVVARSGESARATFAQLRSEPASHNTVPATVRCTLDLRHHDGDGLDRLEQEVRAELEQAARFAGVEASLERQDGTAPVPFDPVCVATVRESADALGARHRDIVSGAGHDSCYVAGVAPAAMVFVPCEGGVSHNEAESITPDQAELGASVLLGAVLRSAGTTDPARITEGSRSV